MADVVSNKGVTIILKKGTRTQWTDSNYVLKNGEIAFEYGTGIRTFKIGDGENTWNQLGGLRYYADDICFDGSSQHTSVNHYIYVADGKPIVISPASATVDDGKIIVSTSGVTIKDATLTNATLTGPTITGLTSNRFAFSDTDSTYHYLYSSDAKSICISCNGATFNNSTITISQSAVFPTSNSTINLGSASYHFATIYGDNLTGTAAKADTIKIEGTAATNGTNYYFTSLGPYTTGYRSFYTNPYIEADNSSDGESRIAIGGTVGSDRNTGALVLAASSGSTKLISGASSTQKTITFPDSTGTVALTSDLPTAAAGYMIIGGYKICWGDFTATMAATTAAGSTYYSDSTSISGGSFASAFAAAPTSVIVGLKGSATTLINYAPVTVNASGITKVRIWRTGTSTGYDANLYYVAFGKA